MRGRLLALVVATSGLVLPVAAAAQVAPYDGSIPFACTLQQAGFEADVPDPGADPFCVEFDKRRQNVSELGIVDFLSKEPARVANASPKCFYFQRDHWRASLVQDVPPAIYEWDGSYFFDKARGVGGVYVENFKVGGQTGDPRQLPGFPEEYKPYYGPGRGGVQSTGSVPVDASCGNRPAPDQPGAGGGRESGGERSASGIPCRVPGGLVGRSIGGVRLGMARRSARGSLGAPATESARYMTWCFEGGGRLVAAFTGRRDRARAQLVLTDSPPFDARGVRVGTSSRVAKRRLKRERRLAKVRGATALVVRERKRQLLVGVARGRVAWVAIAGPKLSRRGVVKLLRAAP
jgi:hypothetical protein